MEGILNNPERMMRDNFAQAQSGQNELMGMEEVE
jgi:hypothetical protein